MLTTPLRRAGIKRVSAVLRRNLILLPLFAALLWSACGKMPERVYYRSGTEYFPLLHDRSLSYRQTEDGKVTEYTLTTKYIGGRHWKVYKVVEENTPYGGIEFVTDGETVRAETSHSLTSLESREELGSFMQVWLNESLPEDCVWVDEVPGTESLISGYFDVIVPAGTFESCMQTVTTPLPAVADSVEARYQRGESSEALYIKERAVANWQTVRWFAAGVGLVKEQIGPLGDPKITRELVAVTAEGVGKIDSLLNRRNETNP